MSNLPDLLINLNHLHDKVLEHGFIVHHQITVADLNLNLKTCSRPYAISGALLASSASRLTKTARRQRDPNQFNG